MKYLIAFLVIILFTPFEFDSSDIKYNLGNNFINDPTNVIMIDTFTVKTFTTVADSLITSRANRLLCGNFINQFEIETYCESYLRFDPCGELSLHSTARFDSICFLFELDGYHKGDTTMVGEFEICRLTEDIVLDDESKRIYHWTQFQSESTPMATFKIDYSDNTNQISVRLSDELGQELFNAVNKAKPDTIITDYDAFLEYFKGVVIRPVGHESPFVFGIKAIADSLSSPRMRVYYSDFTTVDDLYFDFQMENDIVKGTDKSNWYAFSHIMNNYKGTFLEGIAPGETKIASTETENVTFIQRGSMLKTRIEIPYVDDLNQFGLGTIVKAELYLVPVKGSFNKKSDLPLTLQMYYVDNKNELADKDDESANAIYIEGSKDVSYGLLNFNNDFINESYYSYDITSYIKKEHQNLYERTSSVMLSIPYNSTLPEIDQLIIGSSDNVENRLKLKVYLTKF